MPGEIRGGWELWRLWRVKLPRFSEAIQIWGCWKTQTVDLFPVVLETQPVAMFGEAFLPRFPGAGALGDGGGTSGRAEGDGPRGMVP